MDNKLSELSKPVMYSITCNGVVEEIGGDSQGFVREEVQAELDSWENGSVGIPDGYSVSELYSQEYVSALLAELEAKDDALRAIAFHVSAGGYNADSVDSEVFKQKITDGINSISDVQIKRIAELERANTSQDDHINQQQDRIDSLEKTNAGLGQRLGAAENRLATPVPTVKFAGYGLYHAERDEFGSWLKATPQGNCSDAITKHGYVNVKLFTAPPEPAVPDDYQHLKNVQELYHRQEDRLFSIAQRIKGEAFDKYSHVPSQAIDVLEREIFGVDGGACRAAMLAQPVSSGYKLPPHVYRELVNSLRDTAVKYQGTQQLREQLSRTLMKNGLSAAAPEGGNDHDTRR